MSIFFTLGSSQALSMGTDLPVLNNVAGATLMCWFVPSSVGTGMALISISVGPVGGLTATSRANLEFTAAGNLFGNGRSTDAEAARTVTDPAVSIVAGQRAHFAASINFTGKSISLYKNGALLITGAAAFTNNTTPATNSKCGAIGSGDDSAAPFLDGSIEDARIYTRAMGGNEILTIFASRGHDNILNGLFHRYTLADQSTDGTPAVGVGSVKDFMGNRNLTPVNTPTYSRSELSFRRKGRSGIYISGG